MDANDDDSADLRARNEDALDKWSGEVHDSDRNTCKTTNNEHITNQNNQNNKNNTVPEIRRVIPPSIYLAFKVANYAEYSSLLK